MTFDRLAEDYAININEAEKLIKEYEASVLNEEDASFEIEDYIAGLEMLGEAIELLTKLINYKKQ